MIDINMTLPREDVNVIFIFFFLHYLVGFPVSLHVLARFISVGVLDVVKVMFSSCGFFKYVSLKCFPIFFFVLFIFILILILYKIYK